MFLLGQVLLLLPQLGVGVPRHPHCELGGVKVVHQLVSLHVILFGHIRELFDVLLVVALLPRAKRSDETFGLILMLIVDKLEVHVDEHRVED